MKKTKAGAIVIGFSLLVLSGIPAYATLIYSTFGEGGSYSSETLDATYYGQYEKGGYNSIVVAQFRPSSDFLLDSITFASSNLYNQTHQATVSLTSSTHWDINTYESMSVQTSSMGIYTVTSNLHPGLEAGTLYWVMISSPDAWETFSPSYWLGNNIGLKGVWIGAPVIDEIGWYYSTEKPTPAFAVYGSPVPIPGAAWLLGSGIVGLIGLKRRMRK